MTTIEEIPIDVSEEAQPDEQTEPVTEPMEEEPTEPAPKKRGRPPGSRNRVAKPKVVAAKPKAAKPKKKAQPPPPSDDEEEEDYEEEEYEPPPRRKARARAPPQEEYEEEPAPLDPRLVAAEMLSMLSQRNVDRNAAKRQKYASWFPTNRAVY